MSRRNQVRFSRVRRLFGSRADDDAYKATSANRQGSLHAFLEVESGSGSYAPRKRQAYASKRLQQVVSDFRKQRAKRHDQKMGTPAPSQDGDFASEGETGPSKKRRKTTASNEKKTASLTGKTRQKRTSGKRKKTDAASTEEESTEDGEGLPASLIPSRPLSITLRPRPGPEKKMENLAEHSSLSTDQKC